MLVDICKKCNKRIALADGLCNYCSEKPVKQQILEAAKKKSE